MVVQMICISALRSYNYQFAVFNPAAEYQPYTKRNKPQLIPKIFHIICIDDEMPFKKQLVLKLNKLRYPDFEFKIWSVRNITKQKFPISYKLLMNIYNIQKISRFSKRATMADVYRHQILYNQGGIYMDTSMVLFNSELSKMLSYKLFLGAFHTFRHRWSQAMCIFAVMPKFQPLLREILPLNTNHYNIFLRNALEIGPQDFRWIVRGYEQFDPDYLIMNLDSFYPVSYDNQDSYYTTYCYIQEDNLRPNQEIFYQFEKANRVMPLNCGNYYPYSFGKEVNDFGGTWQLPKW